MKPRVRGGYRRVSRRFLRLLAAVVLAVIALWAGLLVFAVMAMIGGQHP